MRALSSSVIASASVWTASLIGCGPTSAASSPIPIPARVVADRFIAAPITMAGDTLGLMLDTGGGLNMMCSTAVQRLGLPIDSVTVPSENGGQAEKWGAVPFPTFAPNASIPGATQVLFRDKLGVPRGMQALDSSAPDGFLGRFWFADRIWVLDYPRKTLSMLRTGSAALPPGPHQARLGFAEDVSRKRATNFPRIRVLIDGDSVDMLFDTGATMSLTPSAHAALADSLPSERATSFVAQSVFDRWRQRHPDWRVLEHADSIGVHSFSIIEVPAVSVGGHTVGPSWWAMRPDAVYVPYREWMDQPIHGSIGGSVFHYFKITLDYPHALATFER